MKRFFNRAPAWLTSMIVHLIAMLVLALMTVPGSAIDRPHEYLLTQDLEPLEPPETNPPPLPLSPDMTTGEMIASLPAPPSPPRGPDGPSVPEPEDDRPPEIDYTGFRRGPDPIVGPPPGGTQISDREVGYRDSLSRPEGRAVAMGLKWLAAHQMPDGGWSFAHPLAPNCRGQCRNPGELTEARTAATSLALLSFLGAGQTHKSGQYRQTVKSGLYFLVSRMKAGVQGGSLLEPGGQMYSHGLASMVLCEAYAISHDKGLFAPAQSAVNFICYAQDPVGGGWRYQPRQRGDTSVVGWQIMALKSGHLAYLRVPTVTIRKAVAYLDTVQANRGANYGYTDPGSGPATTAIGLLCRMHLGWKSDEPALERGVRWLAERGPSKSDLYYDYYATQVMRQWGGDLWEKWDGVMRPQLVQSQATRGHEQGSWSTTGDHGASKGGRLYSTAMATMILEVYYRILIVTRQQSIEENFPL
jgi:hypothetical protein